MKRLIYLPLYFLSLLILFTACEEQEVTFLPSGESAFPSSERVEASFYGRLLNQNLEPVIEAQVWVGDRMALSDSLGDWIIPKVEVVSRQAYIKVEAEGYFPASRVQSVLPNSMNLVRIMPTVKQAYEAVQSSVGGEVRLPDGSSLTFQPGSFVDELTGAPYNGEVRVYAYAIEGRSESSQVQMPGRLESTTADAALVSFGMIVTDLETPNGESLQLKEGLPATIRYEQEQTNGNTPDTIPLWHFDEAVGTWTQEGFSVRQGNAYLGEVVHFSWWNCDWPQQLVNFCIQFSCTDSVPTLTNRSSSEPSYCLTAWTVDQNDLLGVARVVIGDELKYCDILPANSEIKFDLQNSDNTVTQIGPLRTNSEDINFGTFSIDCSVLDAECGRVYPPPPTAPAPPPAPEPLVSEVNWSAANCSVVGEPVLIRIASTERNSTPIIIDGLLASDGSTMITLPATNRIIVTMHDPSSGKVLDRSSYYPHPIIDIGSVNPSTGVIGALGYEVKGRLLGCDAGLSDVIVRLLALDGSIIDEARSSPTGRFSLNTTECDGRGVEVSILASEGEQVISTDLFSDVNLGDIEICAANGDYYWKAKVNGRQFSYLACNGRAGNSGWVAYASDEPDPSVPFFGIDHSGQIASAMTYQVGPDLPIKFTGFRLGQYSFTSSSHPFEGQLRVTEYGSVAAGVFTGTCMNSEGEAVDLEVEMRFVKP